jgi:hypothetical protein
MIDPETWDASFDREGKDEHKKGLLTMKMAGTITNLRNTSNPIIINL